MSRSKLCSRLLLHRIHNITPLDFLLIGAVTMLMILSTSTVGFLLFLS
jgi:hypothetical protein